MTVSMLAQVAERLGQDEQDVADFLEKVGVDLRHESTVQHHRLRISRIFFEGMKEHAQESGAFTFDRTLAPGCWAVASDDNLTGKTTVISVAKWALRGSPDDLTATVRKWLTHITVEGEIDALPFVIDFDPRTVKGHLSVGPTGASARTEFAGKDEFEHTVCEFFENQLGLPPIPGHQATGGGRAVSNGWPAYLNAMWISDAADDLLLGSTTFGALPQRLLSMFLAVPGSEASFALYQAIKLQEDEVRRLAADPTEDARRERVVQLREHLETLRARRDTEGTLDPVAAARRVAEATTAWQKAAEAAQRAEDAWRSAKDEYDDAAHELRQLERESAAARVMTALSPSRCPRCAAELDPSHAEATTCYVCTHSTGGPPQTGEGVDPIEGLTEEVSRLSIRLDAAAAARSAALAELAEMTTERDQAVQEHERQRGGHDGHLHVEIARLEGALGALEEPLGAVKAAGEAAGANLAKLKKIRKLLDQARKADIAERYAAVNSLLTSLLHDLGFVDAQSARITLKAGLELTYTSGASTSFKDLSDGEKARARLAAIIAMLREGGGRHPGLVVYDSLGNAEITDEYLSVTLKALAKLAAELGIQVLVTHEGHAIAVEALGNDRVIGPASKAGHIF